MSVLNLSLQSVSLMQEKMPKEFEELLSNCGTIASIRQKAISNPRIKPEITKSLQPVKELMSSTFSRLQLKEMAFRHFEAASQADIDEL